MVTPDRDLHTGVPLWEDFRVPRLKSKALDGNIDTDIAIIGAGVSGAMMAEALSGQGLGVVILDRNKPAYGSTLASTCLIQYEIDEPLIHLAKKAGAGRAARAWRRSRLAVESLSARLRNLDIECGLERRDSLYLNGDVLDPMGLERESDARRAIGLETALVHRKEMRDRWGIRAQTAILSRDNLTCNPVQMTRGFLNAAIKRGVMLYKNVDVLDMKPHHGGWTLITASAHKIHARSVVYATGYDIPRYIKTRKHKIISTWALATAPMRLPPDMPLVWEAADPYGYARPTPDGRLLFGGEDEEMDDEDKRDALLKSKTKTLLKKLRHRFPDLDPTVTHAWTGFFGTSTTGLPSIGAIPGMKNCYAVMAYGGNGITFSRIAADIIPTAILGGRDPDTDVFGF